MGNGGPIDKSLMQTFVPVNSLSGDNLDRLLDHQEVRTYRAGETLFSMGEQDNTTVYLLSGSVELRDSAGNKTAISAGGMESWHPVDHCQPRRSTAVALSDVSVVKFDSFRLDTILSWDQSAGYVLLDINSNAAYEDDREWMIRLLKSRLFFKVPPGNILEIFRRLKPRRYRAGDVVINQGDDADCCYIIKDGICEVNIVAAGATESTPVAMLEPGQWFGEEALLSGKPRNASVVMATDGILMRLDRKDFDQLLREPVVNAVTVDQALERIAGGARWVDVRTPDEYELFAIQGAINIPLNILRLKARMLDASKVYVVCCDTGRRSASAAFLLKSAGIDVYVLDGGINASQDKLGALLVQG